MSTDVSCQFRFDEVRSVLRLTSELRELPQGSRAQRLHALEGFAALVGAQVGLWLVMSGVRSGRPTIRDAIDVGWSGEQERRAFLAYLGEAQQRSSDPALPRMMEEMRDVSATRTRDQLVRDADWYGSEHVNEFRRAARVDSFIYTAHLGGGADEIQCISLHRAWGDRPFSDRERLIIEAFQRESTWLYRPAPVEPGVNKPLLQVTTLLERLPRRLRDTMTELLAGLSEKQVADRLGLSTHTVHGYVKSLYRHFRVSSRAELLALCLARGARRQ